MFKRPSPADHAVQRINITELYEVRQWAERYACTPEELKAAIGIVGNAAGDVRRHLTPPKPVPKARAALEAAFDGGLYPQERLTELSGLDAARNRRP